MLRPLSRHMRHNVVAYLALFLALSGSAMAAKPLIDGADVQDESLTGADVQNDSLTGADVDESSLDIVESSLGKVGDADTLDGKNSTDFLGATAKAADADTLDGKDSTEFGTPNTVVQAYDADRVHTFGQAVGQAVVNLGSVNVTPGTWLFVAKATVGTGAAVSIPDCYLSPNNTTRLDESSETVTSTETDSLSLTTVETFAANTTVTMSCRDRNNYAHATDAHITAIRAG